jgi:hypothetical protein
MALGIELLMHLHRTARMRYFTVLGNEVLRDNRLSFCARGILGYLLSLPDGQRTDIRALTDRTPEGRERVASALRELEALGYLRRTVKRTPEGRLFTDVDVYDTPGGASSQVTPGSEPPGSGDAACAADGDHPVKKQDEEPTLPPAGPPDDPEPGRAGHGSPEDTAHSLAVLARLARAEPRLSLGHGEAAALAPLVTQWCRRGVSDPHIITSLTSGLPATVHSPAALVADRLRRKLPAQRTPARPRFECEQCRAPVPTAGVCLGCRRPELSESRCGIDFADVRSRGAALARSVLRGASVPVGPIALA